MKASEIRAPGAQPAGTVSRWRIARIEPGRILLARPGQRLWCRLEPAMRPGELVVGSVVEGALGHASSSAERPGSKEPARGVPAVLRAWRELARPQRALDTFPPPDSDWARFDTAEGALWRAVHARALLLRALRRWFEDAGFVEVDTPAVASSPGTEVHIEPVQASLRLDLTAAQRSTRWLVPSPELHMKRLLSVGFERIFQLGRVFRSGERTAWHNPEFTLLEWYRSPGSWRDVLEDTASLVQSVSRAVAGTTQVPWRGGVLDLGRWEEWTFRSWCQRVGGFDPEDWRDAAALRQQMRGAGIGVTESDSTPSDLFERAIVERLEPGLPTDRVVAIVEYPACMASLARRVPSRPAWAERFEVYVGGVELANGFGELLDADEQRRRCETERRERARRALDVPPLDDRFLDALALGVPPSAGVAVGVDRLLMILLGMDDISFVVPFTVEHA